MSNKTVNATSNADLTRNQEVARNKERAKEEQGNVEGGEEDEDDEEERGDQALLKRQKKVRGRAVLSTIPDKPEDCTVHHIKTDE